MSTINRQGERGTVLLVVILLVIMFTGLGLLAMRHTRLELRSTGAYLDSAQAGKLAEGGVALVATDLRLSSDYYQFMFTSSDSQSMDADAGTQEEQYTIPLSTLFLEGDAGPAEDGTISQLSGTLATNAEQAAMYGIEAATKVTQATPVLAPCPPGYSCVDDQNYGWYYFTMNSTAVYGPPESLDGAHPLYERGRAKARGRVTVGPIAAYGQ